VSAVGGRQRYRERHPGDDLALYALDGLEGDEARDVEDHLAECGACRRELAAHEEALAALVEDGPPPWLWDAVEAQIRGTGAPPATGPGPAPLRAVGSTPAPLDAGAHRGMRRRLALLAAAATVAAIAGIGVGARLGDRGGEPTTVAGGPVDGPTIAVLADGGGSEVAHVVAGADGDVLVLDDLPELRKDRSYQLWSAGGTRAVSLGVLGDGSVEAMEVRLPPAVSQLAISEEPSRGSPEPSGPILASGPVVRPA
jgi:anti-sigma-K factor RskA